LNIHGKSLYFRLALLGAAASFVSVLVLGGFIAYSQGKQFKQAALEEAELITQGFANSIAEDLIVKNYGEIDQKMNRVLPYPKVVRWRVTNAKKQTIIDAIRHDEKSSWKISHGSLIDLPIDQNPKIEVNDDRIVIWVPVNEHDILGWINAEILLESVITEQKKVVIDTVSIAGISFVISTLIFILFLKRPMSQIKRATGFATRLPQEFGRQLNETSSHEELNDLIEALNVASIKLFEQDQNLNMLQALIEYSDDPVYILDIQDSYRMAFANNAACRHFQISRQELLKLRVPDWDPDISVADLDKLIDNLRSSKSATFVSRHKLADGRLIPVEISANYIIFAGKELIAGYFKDISQRVAAEEELMRARDNAEKSARAKAQFLANMSHEIRTPMNGIIGLTQLALNEPMSDEARDCLEKVAVSSNTLLIILNDILDFSRLEANAIIIEHAPFGIRVLLNNLRILFSHAAKSKSLDFSIDLDDAVPEQLIGDSIRLQQILCNLLGNAIKFTESGFVKLVVSSSKLSDDQQRLTFSVEDSGIGISHADIEKLFEPFAQADSSITRKFGGTGLGLAISHNLLQLMGGHFTVKSQLGQGTCFTFDLVFDLVRLSSPTADKSILLSSNASKAGGLQHAIEKSGTDLRGKRVLIAEDNRINQKITSGFLNMAGIEVMIAENGEEALERLEHEHYDAILMDIQMPILDGREATKRIRLQPQFANLPIIALTAGVTEDEQASYFAVGMNDFLPKPIQSDPLIKMLKKWLIPK